jgi:hypothetical protein
MEIAWKHFPLSELCKTTPALSILFPKNVSAVPRMTAHT